MQYCEVSRSDTSYFTFVIIVEFFFPGFDNSTAVIGSAEQYYDYSVLKKIDDISGGIGMPDLKLTACLAACYLVLFLTLWKGSSFIYVFYFRKYKKEGTWTSCQK